MNQVGRLLVRVINNTGDNQFPPSSILPVGPFRVSIRSAQTTRIYDAATERDVDFEYRPGRVDCTLEPTEQYHIFVIENEH